MQSVYPIVPRACPFGYHLKQHNSQTSDLLTQRKGAVGYHLKQHNSQTARRAIAQA